MRGIGSGPTRSWHQSWSHFASLLLQLWTISVQGNLKQICWKVNGSTFTISVACFSLRFSCKGVENHLEGKTNENLPHSVSWVSKSFVLLTFSSLKVSVSGYCLLLWKIWGHFYLPSYAYSTLLKQVRNTPDSLVWSMPEVLNPKFQYIFCWFKINKK